MSGVCLLLSFDIDGTLAVGDPPGPIGFDMLHRARSLGHVIGSSSDRTLREQREIWEREGMVPDFVNRKHELAQIRHGFPCERFIHIGDTAGDEECARRADFEFVFVGDLAAANMPWLFGTLGMEIQE